MPIGGSWKASHKQPQCFAFQRSQESCGQSSKVYVKKVEWHSTELHDVRTQDIRDNQSPIKMGG